MVYAKKIHHLIPLGLILTLAAFLKIPSLFEPNHYGDEGIYQVIGQVVHRGGLLYRDVWDNKPPFLYLLYSFFNGDQFSIRLLSLIFTLLTTFVFYLLARLLFPKQEKTCILTTAILAILFSLPLLEGNIANAENFMYLPIILAFYLFLKNFPKTNFLVLFFSGFLFSLAFLLKIVAVFDLGTIFAFVIISFWGKWRKILSLLFLLSLGFALPIIATGLFFLSQGIFKEFILASFSQNVSYVAWGNKFLIAQGWLILKLFLLSLFAFLLLLKRREFEPGQILVFLWFAFSLFNAFFAQRPWIHYLLVLVPSFSLLLGYSLKTKKFRTLTIFFLILTLFLGKTEFWVYGKTLQYYTNFFSFISGQKTLQAYRDFWGGHVSRDYRAAQFLNLRTGENEPVFVWGNNAQIYVLAKRRPATRYTVAYHMSFSPNAEDETIKDLKSAKPKYFLILLPETEPLGKLDKVLYTNYKPAIEDEGFKVYERLF